jgi:hypothetical protein
MLEAQIRGVGASPCVAAACGVFGNAEGVLAGREKGLKVLSDIVSELD